eukprot:TRINITY_DN18453_c0_g1_i1.p1 TRINITY_DN18453_c0_g1~~TRINITY_DN18453_c0_g1_i1.p1  ORF type:complete len:366 (+),score=87.32 TRINITY_DN18453_c0_g1_i1:97-1098(+)
MADAAAAARLPHRIFVYGTLKRLFANHFRYLGVAERNGSAEYLGRALTEERFPLVVRPPELPPLGRCGPVMLDRPGAGERILGEVFRVSDQVLAALDILEDVARGSYFKRVITVEQRSTVGMREVTSREECTAYLYPAKEELLALEHFAEYTADHHAKYRPGPSINEEILRLCGGHHGTPDASTHHLVSDGPCSLRCHALRLLPGDDLLQALRAFSQSRNVEAMCVLSAVGSTGRTTLRPAGVPKPRVFEDKYEIVSLTGTLSRHGHHLHMSISDANCAVYGGHVLEGCIVRTTCELVLGELEGSRFERPLDPRTGYDELSISAAGRKRPRED